MLGSLPRRTVAAIGIRSFFRPPRPFRGRARLALVLLAASLGAARCSSCEASRADVSVPDSPASHRPAAAAAGGE
jgi:hypothetical protein